MDYREHHAELSELEVKSTGLPQRLPYTGETIDRCARLGRDLIDCKHELNVTHTDDYHARHNLIARQAKTKRGFDKTFEVIVKKISPVVMKNFENYTAEAAEEPPF